MTSEEVDNYKCKNKCKNVEKLKLLNVGKGRYHNTTGIRGVSLVLRESGMTLLEGEEESMRQGINVQLKELSISGG